MGYTFSGSTTNTPSGNTSTVTLSVGATANPTVIVCVSAGNGVGPGGTLTVGGQSATAGPATSNDECCLFYVTLTGGLSGNQSIAFTLSGLGGSVIAFALWYTTDTLTAGNTSVLNGTNNNTTISVTAGQDLFAFGGTSAGSQPWTGSTQTLNINNVASSTLFNSALDCVVAATGTFTIASGNNFVFIAAIAFTAVAPPTSTPAFYSMMDPPSGYGFVTKVEGY